MYKISKHFYTGFSRLIARINYIITIIIVVFTAFRQFKSDNSGHALDVILNVDERNKYSMITFWLSDKSPCSVDLG
jgi:hypothetical protein